MRLTKTIAGRAQWLRDLPARTALRVTNHPTIRKAMSARHIEALAGHRQALPVLSEFDRGIVDAIDRDGIYMTSLDALAVPGTEALLAIARKLVEDFTPEAHAQARSGRDFIIVDPRLLVEHPEIFYWGLEDRLLDIAESYIGLPPAYDGVAINFTVADGREISTRSWHRDWEDRRVLKVALYLHDVDQHGGPFELISSDQARQCDRSGYTYGLARDAELRRQFGEEYANKIVSCTGAAGTVIFADTGRFYHRGKPAVARDRHAIFYSYFSRQPRHPFLCERTGMARRDIYSLSDPLPVRQRSAAQWRRELSPHLRLIPAASL